MKHPLGVFRLAFASVQVILLPQEKSSFSLFLPPSILTYKQLINIRLSPHGFINVDYMTVTV